MAFAVRWILVLVASGVLLIALLWLTKGGVVKREWALRRWRRRWKGTGYPRWGR
jgi:uncharacterized membrane protein (Fun14 family)